MCQGKAVRKGTFTMTVDTSGTGNAGVIMKDQTQYHASSYANLNAFLYPTAYSTLTNGAAKYSNNGKTVTVSFGSIAAGRRFWMSTFFNSTGIFGTTNQYNIQTNLQVTCADGQTFVKKAVLSPKVKQFDSNSGGNGQGKYKIKSTITHNID